MGIEGVEGVAMPGSRAKKDESIPELDEIVAVALGG